MQVHHDTFFFITKEPLRRPSRRGRPSGRGPAATGAATGSGIAMSDTRKTAFAPKHFHRARLRIAVSTLRLSFYMHSCLHESYGAARKPNGLE